MERLSRPRARARHWVALAAALCFASASCTPAPQLGGVLVDPPRDVAAFTFTLPSGETVSTAPQARQPVVLFFGYTHCPDICPNTLADWTRVKRQLGAKGDRVRYIFVSVDPERDTPDVAERYAAQFDSAFVGVSGDARTTEGIMAAFGVTAAREIVADSANYLVSHPAQVYLVNPSGQLVAMYPLGMRWDVLASDLDALL